MSDLIKEKNMSDLIKEGCIFVYGTLKKGMCRNHILKDQHYLGIARTIEGYLLFDCGGWPGLVPSKDDGYVWGELYEVDEICLRQLDKIESIPNLFDRLDIHLDEIHLASIPVSLDSVQALNKKIVMGYHLVANHGKTVIESGVWLDD